jgi:hypothetical protein
MAVQSRTQSIAISGSSGSATGAAEFSSLTPSKLLAVRLNYTGQPATADVVLKTAGDVIFTVSNANTNATFRPRAQAHDSSGAAVAGSYVPFTLDGSVRIEVAQGNAGSVEATLIVEV